MKLPVEIASIVNSNMPSTGFFSRSKRIEGYNLACRMIEELSSDEGGNVDMEKAAEAAAILTHMNNRFHKSLHMTVLNFDRLPIGYLNEIAYRFAESIRTR